MNDSFFETSKNIANQFLQSIVFIDDKAYQIEDAKNHHFDAFQISQTFSRSKKICAVYKPETANDIDDLAQLAKKADTTVLDWQIIIKEVSTGREEEDAEEDDPRGPHTRKIIREIITDSQTGKDCIKLIIIYTGETGLYDITDTIYNDLDKLRLCGLVKGNCQVNTENIKILIVAKPSTNEGEPKFKHAPELNSKVVNYDELPEFILNEFTKMTTGLLSNFILKSLTVLRENTFQLIRNYNQNLDSAFLAHKALLPNPEDALEHIVDILGSDLKSILKGNHSSELVSDENISKFINEIIVENVKFEIQNKESFKEVAFPDYLSPSDLKIIVQNGASAYFMKKQNPFEDHILFDNNCHKTLTNCFSSSAERANDSNIRFAKLTTMKSFYNDDFSPILTQGTILKDEKNDNEYYLCIQPKCDSVRIQTIKRDFLLLRLYKVIDGKSFDIAIDESIKLKIDYSVYNSKLIGFKTKEGKISPLKNGVLRKFERWDNKKMIWMAELKNDFAQSISNLYAANLSRVAMDHSEWLRRS